MALRFVKSQKGKDLLAYNAYFYRLEGTLANSMNWRCVEDKKFKCKARAITPVWNEVGTEEDVVTRGEHSHPPDPVSIQKKEIQSFVKERASSTNDAPRIIVQEALGNAGEEVAARCRSNENLANAVRRKRRAEEAFPPPPVHRHGFDIPPALRERLLVDTGSENPQRILIYGNIERLAQHSNWFQDGTFKVAPEVFYQAYTIHATIESSAVPCVYALLPNKTRLTYERMWTELKDLGEVLNPERLMTDFEKAAINAFTAAFPNATISGCHFHLGQSVWRKIQELGHRNRYVEDEEFRMRCKGLLALAFLPADEVVEAFEELEEGMPDELENLVLYFEDTYIGRPRRRGRANPLFPIPLWNMHERVLDGLARTNNAVEGWHRAFQGSLQSSHPTLWRYIEAIRKEMAFQDGRYAQVIGGNNPDRRRWEYEARDRRINRLVEGYLQQTTTRQQFLRGISHNVEINI